MTTVHVTRNSEGRSTNKVYHSDPECHRVELGSMREVSEEQAAERMGLTECKHCTGEVDKSHTGPTLAYEVLNRDE